MGFLGIERIYKSKIYTDLEGKKTIAWGHKVEKSDSNAYWKESNKEIQKADAEKLFGADIELAEKRLKGVITVPLYQREFDALLSLVFNMGMHSEWMIYKHVNWKTDNYLYAGSLFKHQNKVTDTDGKKVPSEGLTNRRNAESNIYFNEVYNGP